MNANAESVWMPNQFSNKWLMVLAVGVPAFVLTICLRLLLIGGPPFSDEGIYGTVTQSGDLTFGFRVNFYQWIATIAGIPANTPLLNLRLFDMSWAALASGLMGIWLLRWSTCSIAIFVSCTWSVFNNAPEFVQCGFKNPILAATALLLLSLILATSESRINQFLSGIVVCGAIALREPFLFTPVTTLFTSFWFFGNRGILLHLVGLCLGSAIILAIIATHDDLFAVLYRYSIIPNFYRSLDSTTDENYFLPRLFETARLARWFIIPSLGIVYAIWKPPEKGLLAVFFAILLMLPFAPEIIGYPNRTFQYHFAQLSVGLALLNAVGMMALRSNVNSFRMGWVVVCILSVLLSGPMARSYFKGWQRTEGFASVMIRGNWNSPATQRSTYLMIADYLRENTPNDATVAVTGGMSAVNILARRATPSSRVYDLGVITRSQSQEEITASRYETAMPDYIVESTRWPEDLSSLWPNFDEQYELVYELPPTKGRHYGDLGAKVWRRRQ